MIQKDDDQRQLVCDGCGTEGPVYDEDDFDRMIAEAKGDGWSIRQIDGKWEHNCSACAGHSALDRARKKFGIK